MLTRPKKPKNEMVNGSYFVIGLMFSERERKFIAILMNDTDTKNFISKRKEHERNEHERNKQYTFFFHNRNEPIFF